MFEMYFSVTSQLNHLAILVATLAAMMLGMLWYSPALFGEKWLKLAGLKMPKKGEGGAAMARSTFLGFLRTWVLTYVFAHFMMLIGYEGALGGLEMALWVWLGFLAMGGLSGVIWEGYKMPLFLIHQSYNLVALVIAGLILGVWV